jgi:hypothetical protein
MITRDEVNAAMLAQARGCVHDNQCWDDCEQNAREALDEDREEAIDDWDLEWINAREWVP